MFNADAYDAATLDLLKVVRGNADMYVKSMAIRDMFIGHYNHLQYRINKQDEEHAKPVAPLAEITALAIEVAKELEMCDVCKHEVAPFNELPSRMKHIDRVRGLMGLPQLWYRGDDGIRLSEALLYESLSHWALPWKISYGPPSDVSWWPYAYRHVVDETSEETMTCVSAPFPLMLVMQHETNGVHWSIHNIGTAQVDVLVGMDTELKEQSDRTLLYENAHIALRLPAYDNEQLFDYPQSAELLWQLYRDLMKPRRADVRIDPREKTLVSVRMR